MSDDIVLEHLRLIRGDLAEIKTDLIEVRERLGLLAGQSASLSRRMDRVVGEVELIKRRLSLAEA